MYCICPETITIAYIDKKEEKQSDSVQSLTNGLTLEGKISPKSPIIYGIVHEETRRNLVAFASFRSIFSYQTFAGGVAIQGEGGQRTVFS